MRWRTVPHAALLAVLGGCVSLSQPAPEIRAFRLDYPPPAIDGSPVPAIVRVARFPAASMYDREPMVYRDDTYTTAVDFYNRWGTHPGQMITDLLARDLASSGVYAAVQQEASLVPSDYLLNGEIEEFEERTVGDRCEAHLRLRIVLLRLHPGKADPSLRRGGYAADEPCTCGEPFALAEAMSKCMARISSQLQQDIYTTIAADAQPTHRSGNH